MRWAGRSSRLLFCFQRAIFFGGGGFTTLGRFGTYANLRRRRPQRRARVGPPPLVECPLPDRPADVRHQPLEEPNIMQGNEDRAKHLAREKIVPDRAPGERPTRV